MTRARAIDNLRPDQKDATIMDFISDRGSVFGRRLDRFDSIIDPLVKKKNKAALTRMLTVLYQMQAELYSYASILEQRDGLARYFEDQHHTPHLQRVSELIVKGEVALGMRERAQLIPKEELNKDTEEAATVKHQAPASREAALTPPEAMIKLIGKRLKHYQKQIDAMNDTLLYPLRIKDKTGTYSYINGKSKELISTLKLYRESLSASDTPDKKQLAKVEKQIDELTDLINKSQKKLSKISVKTAKKAKKATRKAPMLEQPSTSRGAYQTTRTTTAPTLPRYQPSKQETPKGTAGSDPQAELDAVKAAMAKAAELDEAATKKPTQPTQPVQPVQPVQPSETSDEIKTLIDEVLADEKAALASKDKQEQPKTPKVEKTTSTTATPQLTSKELENIGAKLDLYENHLAMKEKQSLRTFHNAEKHMYTSMIKTCEDIVSKLQKIQADPNAPKIKKKLSEKMISLIDKGLKILADARNKLSRIEQAEKKTTGKPQQKPTPPIPETPPQKPRL